MRASCLWIDAGLPAGPAASVAAAAAAAAAAHKCSAAASRVARTGPMGHARFSEKLRSNENKAGKAAQTFRLALTRTGRDKKLGHLSCSAFLSISLSFSLSSLDPNVISYEGDVHAGDLHCGTEIQWQVGTRHCNLQKRRRQFRGNSRAIQSNSEQFTPKKAIHYERHLPLP